MTSPYITPTIRSDAAAIVALLRGKTMTRDEIASHFKRSKTALDRAFAFAKNTGKINYYRAGTGCVWAHADEIKRIEAKKAKQAPQETKPEEIDYDAPDMPVLRKIIKAGTVPMPRTKAARWVFDVA